MSEKVVSEAFVLDMVKKHKISASKGAELLGMPLQDFIELMSAHHIPVFEYKEDELEKELKTLRRSLCNTEF
jgi:predicted HTH domain antitoxin